MKRWRLGFTLLASFGLAGVWALWAQPHTGPDVPRHDGAATRSAPPLPRAHRTDEPSSIDAARREVSPAAQPSSDLAPTWPGTQTGLAQAVSLVATDISDCFARSAPASKERHTVEVRLGQAHDGSAIIEAQVLSGAEDDVLTDCVLHALGNARFDPPADGPVSIVWPVYSRASLETEGGTFRPSDP